jgi:hypothetical protein
MTMTTRKDLRKLNTTISKCWIERGFGGYLLDVFSAGGYTTYRTLEYTKCMDDAFKEAVPKIISTADIENGSAK